MQKPMYHKDWQVLDESEGVLFAAAGEFRELNDTSDRIFQFESHL